MLIIGAVYAIYLPLTTYDDLYYDAQQYWRMGEQYFATGQFSFLSFATTQRGYLLSLLLSPLTQLTTAANMSPLDITRVLGTVLAAVCFGWAGPALWQAIAGGKPVGLARRLVFAGLGFVLWRDYFNFSLSDFPSLLALAIALICLLRGQGLRSGVLAGVALAAALNMRPIYQAALPAVALLALLPPLHRARWWGLVRSAALIVGAALVLLPQAYSNYHQVGSKSPLVLAVEPGHPDIFLQQLTWGLLMQKYETSIGDDYPKPFVIFEEAHGRMMWEANGSKQFDSAGEYIRLCASRPGRAIGIWARHLFNGLDVQYPTPYIQAVYVPTWPLAWLNYTVIWGGALVLLLRRWQRPTPAWVRPGLALLALLAPCLVTMITAMECRFLLPLHMLLSAAVAFGAVPGQWWQAATAKWRLAVAASYVVVLVGGFWASATAQEHLAFTPRTILPDLPGYSLWGGIGN